MGKTDWTFDMIRWVETAHPDAFESSFLAECGSAYNCWDGRWITSAEGAQALFDLRDEYLATLSR